MSMRLRLYGLRFRIAYRLINRWHDTVAVRAGYCNRSPWSPAPNGGYSQWRCAHRRGHDGAHRYRNYTWTDDGGSEYAPIADGSWPRQPHDRHGVLTLRQERLRKAWVAADADRLILSLAEKMATGRQREGIGQ